MSRLTINSNIASLNAQRNFGIATKKLSESYTRLSSGLRINRAVDDAAGLSISESLKADTRIYNQGVRNLNDGVSLLNIADGALGELSSIAIRLNELAEQSANGTLGSKQRLALDKEAQSLSKEYNRIARSTEFNGLKIFDGDFGDLSLAAGGGRESLIVDDLGGSIGDGTFNEAVTYGAGSAYFMKSSDMDNDGNIDLIVANIWTDSTQFYKGNGDGTFALARDLVTGIGTAMDVTIADFNNDGNKDVAQLGWSFGIAYIVLGNSDGTFKANTSYSVGGAGVQSRSLDIGDFDNDGAIDLVVANQGASDFRVILGNRDGSFRSGSIYAGVAPFPAKTKTGDLDQDGILDLVVTNYGAGSFTIYKGNGDGSFKNEKTITGFGNVNDIILDDLNGDGRADIAIGEAGIGGGLYVFQNQGDLNFSPNSTYQTGSQSHEIKSDDFNGDGIKDIMTSDYGDGSVSILIGNGNGTFKARTSYDAGVLARGISINDFNNDGVSDFVVAVEDTNNFRIRLGNSTSGVSALQSFNLKTQSDARESMSYLRNTLERIGQQRGHIGAFQSRVETATNNLQQASLAYSEANSRITDADIAEESSKLTANQIVQQAAASVLGQANLQPRLVLQLLEGI